MSGMHNGRASDAEAEIRLRAERRQRERDAVQEAADVAAARAEVEQEERYIAAQRLCEELRPQRPSIVESVEQLHAEVEAERGKYQALLARHSNACLQLHAHDGRLAAAEEQVRRTAPDPEAELKRTDQVDVVLRWAAKLELADGADAVSYGLGDLRVKPSSLGLAQLIDRAIARLKPAERAEVWRRLTDDVLRAGARRVERI